MFYAFFFAQLLAGLFPFSVRNGLKIPPALKLLLVVLADLLTDGRFRGAFTWTAPFGTDVALRIVRTTGAILLADLAVWASFRILTLFFGALAMAGSRCLVLGHALVDVCRARESPELAISALVATFTVTVVRFFSVSIPVVRAKAIAKI